MFFYTQKDEFCLILAPLLSDRIRAVFVSAYPPLRQQADRKRYHSRISLFVIVCHRTTKYSEPLIYINYIYWA